MNPVEPPLEASQTLSGAGVLHGPQWEALFGVDGYVWTSAVLLALLVALGIWARRKGGRDSGDDWQWRLDLPLLVGLGVLYAGVTGWVLEPHYLRGGGYGDVDFAAYCDGMGALRDGTITNWYSKHSPFAGLLLIEPARRIGVLGALTGGAVVSSGVFAAGLYLWARLAVGRVAGFCTVCFAAANQQLLWLGRSPSFYPETTAACLLGTAAVAAALRWRTPWAVFAGGMGVGLILAADVRFFTVGVWSAALLGLAVVGGPLRRLPLRLGMAVGPVAGWWWAGRWMHGAVMGTGRAPGAVSQAWGFVCDVVGYPTHLYTPLQIEQLDYFWGLDPIWRVPEAMLTLARMSSAIPREAGEAFNLRFERACFLDPWVVPVLVMAVIAALVLARHPWRLIAVFAPAVPFAANLMLAFRTIPQARYEVMGMVVIPLALGVGVGVLGGFTWPRLPTAALVAALGASVLGVVPSFLSPVADWRVPMCSTNRVYDVYAKATGSGPPVPELERESGSPDVQRCVEALSHDVGAGHLWMPFDDTPRRSECHQHFPRSVLDVIPERPPR